MDHSRIPTDDDWQRELDELEDLVAALRQHSATVFARAKGERSPYRARSMGDGGGGGSGDPTADYVLRLAGGGDDGSPDTWRRGADSIGNEKRNMIRETHDARNRLRGATAAMYRALPVVIDDPVREVCQSCGVSKKVAKRWNQSTGRCESCEKRIARQAKAKAS